MNNKSILSLLICVLSFGMLGTSCSDMLEPSMERYTVDKYAQDSVYSAFGILMSVQNVAERSVIIDAAHSDLVTSGTYTTDSIKELIDFDQVEDGDNDLLNVADYYHIINSCNFYLAKSDTTVTKNGYAEMKREWAAIQAIRGWAYLQLVRFYGSVPFITEPVNNTATASRLQKSAPRVTKDNLASLLTENGILDAYAIQHAYGLPNYQSVNNGNTFYATSQMFFPVQFILGDAYLMGNQYAKAAEMYYDYFYYTNSATNNSTYSAGNSRIVTNSVITGRYTDANNWVNAFRNRSASEKYVLSVSATNSFYGTVLNDIHHVYGFATSSTTSSTTLTANEEYQQILPSTSYISLNQAQNYNRYEVDNDLETKETVDGGDARLYGSAPAIEFANGDQDRIIAKFAPCTAFYVNSRVNTYASPSNFSITYDIPLYRNPQIWLRYAEAINRLGFPEIAFGVLKDGLCRQNMPSIAYKDQNKYYVDRTAGDTLGVIVPKTIHVDSLDIDSVVNDTLLYADGATPDSSIMHVATKVAPTAANGGMTYVSVDELLRAANYSFLDFRSNDIWNHNSYATNATAKNWGIHGRGCGDTGGNHDTIYTYAKMVAKKIAENYARLNNLNYEAQQAYEATLHKGDTLLVTDKDLIINAVEDLIADEGALETAFEGHRFTDLVRIAGHKTAAGLNGNEWFAWKIARRAYNVTQDASTYDNALYSKLSNSANWYLPLPTK